MNKKKIFTIAIIAVLAIFGVYAVFFKKTKPAFTLAKVVRDNISQEVSASGVVKQGEEINLAFKNGGRIEKIYVKVGDKIETGQNLVKIDDKEILLQLQEAEASLQVSQAEKANTEVSLQDAQLSLKDTEAKAEENLVNAYQDALNTSDDAYLKIYNAYSTVYLIKRTYFERGDQESITVVDNMDRIKKALDQIKLYIDNAKKTLEDEDIDTTLLKAREALLITKDALEIIRNTSETAAYKDIVSSTDRTSLDTQKLNINTSYDNITSSQQNISTNKINNTTNINTAQSKVSEIESQLQEARGGLYQAKIKQAEASVDLLKNQIEDSVLKSPTNGQITEIKIQEGEIVQSGQLVISMIPDNPFQVSVDIYEEDVVKLAIGNVVDINLTAFSNETLKGKVISIDPDQTLKEGVVYYETTIDFENPPEKIKPGMTADLTITTITKENVLVIPNSAIQEVNGQATVQVLNGKNLNNRQIEIGIKGSNNMVEVISGLKEGEEVAINK